MRDILLVEDEELLSSAFKVILEKDGNNVKTASNGRQALEILETYKPRVIFLDLDMPVMDGIEFLSKYKDKKEQVSKVIVISNLYDKHKVDKTYKLGSSGFFVKSMITPKELCEIAKK